MSSYTASIRWVNAGGDFIKRQYSRRHEWRFDGGCVVPASPSAHVVPAPFSDESAVDPEEALVAAISSCHMLFFLDFASRKQIDVVRYADDAVGVMGKSPEGKMAMTRVTLSPVVAFAHQPPGLEIIKALHHQAHEACFIANSVNTVIDINIS